MGCPHGLPLRPVSYRSKNYHHHHHPPSQTYETISGKIRKCFDTVTFNTMGLVSTIVLDVAILTMPWPIIWRLQMSAQRKIAVTGIFLFEGVLVNANLNGCSFKLIFISRCHGCQYWKTRYRSPSVQDNQGNVDHDVTCQDSLSPVLSSWRTRYLQGVYEP